MLTTRAPLVVLVVLVSACQWPASPVIFSLRRPGSRGASRQEARQRCIDQSVRLQRQVPETGYRQDLQTPSTHCPAQDVSQSPQCAALVSRSISQPSAISSLQSP
jgi:hypothetical protein